MALYCNSAASALHEDDADSTISLYRAYVTTSILQLSIGDVVAAEQTFVQEHLQSSAYLKSNESELADDMIRAVKLFDDEALEKAQKYRAMQSLDPCVRALAMTLKVAGGVAGGKKKQPAAAITTTTTKTTKTTPPPPTTTATATATPEMKNIITDVGQEIDVGIDDDELGAAMDELAEFELEVGDDSDSDDSVDLS